MLARVPWTPPAKPTPKLKRLNADRRKHLVYTITKILKLGEPTKFAFEAACRHGLRSKLCLAGWCWSDAEAVAKEIVDTALNRIGARRPTEREGQPEHTQDGFAPILRTRCVNCGSPLPAENFKFCSDVCANVHHHRQRAIREADEETIFNVLVRPKTRWTSAER